VQYLQCCHHPGLDSGRVFLLLISSHDCKPIHHIPMPIHILNFVFIPVCIFAGPLLGVAAVVELRDAGGAPALPRCAGPLLLQLEGANTHL
jgi:hypothetical protein